MVKGFGEEVEVTLCVYLDEVIKQGVWRQDLGGEEEVGLRWREGR